MSRSATKAQLRQNIDGLRAKAARLQDETGVAKLQQDLYAQKNRADLAERQVRDLTRQLQHEQARAERAEAKLRSLGGEAE